MDKVSIETIKKHLGRITLGEWMCVDADEGHDILMGKAVESPCNCPIQCKIEYNHGCYYSEGYSDQVNEQALEALANAEFIANAPLYINYLLDIIKKNNIKD